MYISLLELASFAILRSYTIKLKDGDSGSSSATTIGVVLYARSFYINRVGEDWPQSARLRGIQATLLHQ